jgi:hypothetical protein
LQSLPVNVVLALSFIASGVLLILVCLPLRNDKIGPNRWYGVRVRKSFESREKWFALNRYGAQQFIRWGGVLAACGVVLLFIPVAERQSTLVLLLAVLPAILIFIPLIQILRYAKKL